MTSCPVCNKPVDPLRARYVAVRAGKVVPYCSPECREAQDTKPTKVPPPEAAAPKPMLDLDSGPVIEILHEPTSGVVTSAKDERTTEPSEKFEKQEIVEEVVKPKPDGSKGSGGADSAAVAGEVSAPKRARSRPSGKHLTRERKDSTESRAGWDWLDEEPAEHARPGTITESERRARWPFVLLLVMIALGAGGFYVWKYILEKQPSADAAGAIAPPAGSDSAVAPVVVEANVMPETPAITPAAAVRQAQDVLRSYIRDGSPRVQRLAAGALGRTGDPAAVAALHKAVKAEKVPAARFRLAYQLARAGDTAGRDALVAGLGAPQRSDKLDAAMHLAHLGDDRAKPLLTSLLGVAQHKLRAAEELSQLDDPAAVKLLEQIRSDPKSSVDEKATATLALFRSGKTELLDDVKQLLEIDSWKAFAAYALAEVKDPAARPLLVDQVKNTHGVRVRAAYALRKLGDDSVVDEVLPELADVLGSPKDQEQIAAAEAILILAGEPQWAAHP